MLFSVSFAASFTMNTGFYSLQATSLICFSMGFTFIITVTCMYFCWKDNQKSEPDFGRFGNYTSLVLVIAITVVTMYAIASLPNSN